MKSWAHVWAAARDTLRGISKDGFHGHSPVLNGAARLLQAEVERIHARLRQFLPAGDARETAMQVYETSLDIDEEIARLLKDPLVLQRHTYDGIFFKPRDKRGLYVAFDGIHLLASLTDRIVGDFFCLKKKHVSVKWLLDHVDKHVWVAKIRRMNWEESGCIGVVRQEVIDDILEDFRERTRLADAAVPALLSAQEKSFFKSLEG